MKKWFLLCVVTLFALSLISGCAMINKLTGAGGTSTGAPSPSVSDKQTVDTVTVVSDKASNKTDYMTLTVDVPKLTGLQNAEEQNAINSIFKSYADSAKKDAGMYEALAKQDAESNLDYAMPYEITIGYTVEYNQNGLLSVLISDYRYTGGAHGGVAETGITIDLNSGTLLTLGDLMVSGSGYKNVINKAIRAEIDKRTGSDELSEPVIFEDIGDYPDFYMTKDGLVFFFQEYEYFPYAAGIQEFPISYETLKGMVKTEFLPK
ncbi:DUF3298 and DUF4163 domain-containing protein [Oscillospiraceae bacterium CM]|nr:DUF3298 and DUF4163 domain-containing protein [Oscillospiraceae bacterium CM]